MPTYGNGNFKESNINYLNKDFAALKQSLMNYAKSYFPNTYRDFNETSPGMMLLEMNAYVGDVLSFYIDQQYRELMFPLAEERRNIINMAKMFGYKVKPIIPAYVDLTFTSEVNANSDNPEKIDYSDAGIWNSGIELTSTSDSDVIFTTLEPIDFRITGSNDTETVGSTDVSGLASTYTLSRTVKAISATQKTKIFQIGVPEKFKKITISDTNVIDIISVVDSNGNNWYEVDFLAQDKVPIPTHYTEDINRDSAYSTATGGVESSAAVPYSLSYIATTKRFTRETNEDNTTSLIFGNGVLKDGQMVDDGYIDMEQVGIIIPGQTNDLQSAIDPLLGDEYSTLGETPNNTSLTVTYRVGGGLGSNIPTEDITTTPSITAQNGNTSAQLTNVTNNSPARGGKNEEDTLEIREKAKAFFTTQNRCVTKEDYEARIMNIPSKYGNIAKVYVARPVGTIESNVAHQQGEFNNALASLNEKLQNHRTNINNFIMNLINIITEGSVGYGDDTILNAVDTVELNSYLVDIDNLLAENGELSMLNQFGVQHMLSSVNIYVLGYNNSKQLIGNPHFPNMSLPLTLTTNIKNYLQNFILLTDTITINDGYIVNFGVIFDVVAEKYADKQQVKLNCIQKIKDYFNINKMQFNQPIYKSQLEYELMGVEGVRSIGHVTITQKDDYNSTILDANLQEATYTYSYDGTGNFEDSTGTGGGTTGYGYKYDFQTALSDDGTIILPPLTSTPTVFELKNPNKNIQGRVR